MESWQTNRALSRVWGIGIICRKAEYRAQGVSAACRPGGSMALRAQGSEQPRHIVFIDSGVTKDHIDIVLRLALLALPTLYIQTDTSRWKTQWLLHCLVYHPSIFLHARDLQFKGTQIKILIQLINSLAQIVQVLKSSLACKELLSSRLFCNSVKS